MSGFNFFGYSNTVGGTPSRPRSSADVSAGQGVARSRSTRRFPKSSRITVKTSAGGWDRRLPGRPGLSRAAPCPAGPGAWPPGGSAAHARCRRIPRPAPCGSALRPCARPFPQTEIGLSLKNGAGFGVSAGRSANRIRFSGATRHRFAEGSPPASPEGRRADLRSRKFTNFRTLPKPDPGVSRLSSTKVHELSDEQIARQPGRPKHSEAGSPKGAGQSGPGCLRESEGDPGGAGHPKRGKHDPDR